MDGLRLRARLRWLPIAGLLLGAPTVAALNLEVRVEGLEGENLTNVLALLSINQERAESSLTESRLSILHRRAPEQIREALAPFGYYRVAIEDSLRPPAAPDGPWVATYRVDPGPAIRIAGVDYRIEGPGADHPGFPGELPLKPGAVLRHQEYEKTKSELRFAAAAGGFLDYRLTRQRVLVDPLEYRALVELHLETGPRYRLGAVTFRQELLDDRLLNRYVDFRPGATYNPDLLIGLQSRLLGTEYFENVEIVPRKDLAGPDNQVPIEVVATPALANKFRVGLEYRTDVGPGFSADWRRRYLNRWGHKFRAQLAVAPAQSSWELDYRIPIRDPTRDYLVIKPQSYYYDLQTYQGWVHGVQVAHSTQGRGGWRRNLGLDFSYQDVADSAATSGALLELAPSVSWSKTVSDDPIRTGEGYRLKYSLIGAMEGLLSETSYLSGLVQFKWIRSFAADYRLLVRTDLGATLAERVEELPVKRRFYAGGDSSIRGWGYDALGPNDPVTDETIGGRYLAVGSLELERTVRGPWSLAVFTDFGNAFDPEYDNKIAASVGAGVRWASPIGQVRLDLAFALNKTDDDRDSGFPPARLHLVIGPDL